MKIKDERVLKLNNQIQSEAYLLVLYLLMISIFIKSFILEMTFLQYAFEFSVIIVSIAYCTLRNVIVGNNFMRSFKSRKASVSIILVLTY